MSWDNFFGTSEKNSTASISHFEEKNLLTRSVGGVFGLCLGAIHFTLIHILDLTIFNAPPEHVGYDTKSDRFFEKANKNMNQRRKQRIQFSEYPYSHQYLK